MIETYPTVSSTFDHNQILTAIIIDLTYILACDPFAKRTKSGVDLSHDEDPSVYDDKGEQTV